MSALRTIRLIYGTWQKRLTALCESMRQWFDRRTCPHSFRAALIAGNPARVCRMCDMQQILTREEFYAEFGERYQAMLNQVK